eukprot:tig00000411_g552.t1
MYLYYKFNEGSGSVAIDHSGRGLNGTVPASPVFSCTGTAPVVAADVSHRTCSAYTLSAAITASRTDLSANFSVSLSNTNAARQAKGLKAQITCNAKAANGSTWTANTTSQTVPDIATGGKTALTFSLAGLSQGTNYTCSLAVSGGSPALPVSVADNTAAISVPAAPASSSPAATSTPSPSPLPSPSPSTAPASPGASAPPGAPAAPTFKSATTTEIVVNVALPTTNAAGLTKCEVFNAATNAVLGTLQSPTAAGTVTLSGLTQSTTYEVRILALVLIPKS